MRDGLLRYNLIYIGIRKPGTVHALFKRARFCST